MRIHSMTKRHPLLPLARLLCDLLPVVMMLQDEDADSSTDEYVQKNYDEVVDCVGRHEKSLRQHDLFDQLSAALAASRALAKERRAMDAWDVVLPFSRTLLEISGQNDIWRKRFGFGHGPSTKQ